MVAKIAVITYTTYGHIDALAQSVIEGITSTGAEVKHFQIQELLSEATRTKMGAAPIRDLPVIKPAQLPEFDGFIFGFGTRFGRAPAQVSAFFDQTGGLWAAGSLVGKFGGIFTGAAGQHGGHESTPFTTLPFFVHHGVTFVPAGFRAPEISNEEHIVGGSPWGASYVAGGQGSLAVLDSDKAAGRTQGASFAQIVNQFLAGKAALAAAPIAESAKQPVVDDVAGVVAAKEEPKLTEAATAAEPVKAVAATEASPLDTLGQPIVDSTPIVAAAPVAAAVDEKATGYEVPATDATPESTAVALTPVEKPTAAEPVVAETKETASTPAPASAADAAPAPKPVDVPAPKAAAPKPKKSFFASCCGSSQANDLKA